MNRLLKISIFVLYIMLPIGAVEAQFVKFSSISLSPNEDRLLFLGKTAETIDLYLLDIASGTLVNLTDNKDLTYDSRYLSMPRWGTDNETIYVISKMTGIAKVYEFNLQTKTLTTPIDGEDTNYYFDIARDGRMVYTKSSATMNPTVFLKDESGEQRISRKGDNCMASHFACNDLYIIYKTMPLGESHIFSLNDKKELKTKLPKKNCSILGWLDDNTCVYTNTTFDASENKKTDLSIYDMQNKTHQKIKENIDNYYDLWMSSKKKSLMWFIRKTTTIYDIETKEETEVPLDGIPVTWSRSGNKIIYQSMSGDKLFMYDLNSKETTPLIQ